MAGFVEPHPSQRWLIDSFFRLHRRRDTTEFGPKAIAYADMLILAEKILGLLPRSTELLIEVVEAADDAYLEYSYSKNAAKLEELKSKTKQGKR